MGGKKKVLIGVLMFIEAWKRLKDLNLWVPPSSSYKSIYKSPEIYTHGPGVNLHFWRKCLICGWVFYSPGDCCEWWVVMVQGAPELDRLFQGFLHIYCFLDPGRRSFFGGGLELALVFRESERAAVRCKWTSRRVRANLILNIWRVHQVCWSVVLINAENLDNHQNCLPLFTVVRSHYCGTAVWNELHLKLNQSSVEQLVVFNGLSTCWEIDVWLKLQRKEFYRRDSFTSTSTPRWKWFKWFTAATEEQCFQLTALICV